MTTPTTFSGLRDLLATTPLPTRRTFEAFDAMRLRLKIGDPTEVDWDDAQRVVRWQSNGRVIPPFVLEKDAGIETWDEQREAYDRETERTLAEYRANQTEPSGEELAEMRAAFGPGATVVDVVSGRRTQL